MVTSYADAWLARDVKERVAGEDLDPCPELKAK
jgi:hypothetical protein